MGDEPGEPLRVFISHRNEVAGEARLLFDSLAGVLGSGNVFLEAEAPPGGPDWGATIEAAGGGPVVLVVLIGPRWLAALSASHERGGAGDDVVPSELEAVLDSESGVHVLPVLVGGASMPLPSELPAPLRPLASLSAVELRRSHQGYDIKRVTEHVRRVREPERPTAARSWDATIGPAPGPGPEPGDAEDTYQDTVEWAAPDNEPYPQRDPGPMPMAPPAASAPPASYPPARSAPPAPVTRSAPAASPPRHSLRERFGFGRRLRRRVEIEPDTGTSIAGYRGAAGVPSPAQAAAAAAAAAKPGEADAVDCTVFAPPVAAPGFSLLVQVFLHTPGQAHDARVLATEFDAGTERRGFRGLELPLPVGTTVDIGLRLSAGVVDVPSQRLVWRGRPEAVQFTVEVPEVGSAPLANGLTGTVVVARDGTPVGRVGFRIALVADAKLLPPVLHTNAQRRFERAFVSYATPDRDEVLKRVQVLRAARIECFQDLLDLEPGERWQRQLYLEIDRTDLFLLFWSRASKESEWVRRETDYALKRQNGDPDADPEIHPVIIEGPPVELPWAELAHLHFNDPIVHMLDQPGD